MERNRDIRRNKAMRAWYRYRKPGGIILAAILVVVLIITLIGKLGKGSDDPGRQAAAGASTEAPTENVTASEPVTLATEAPTEEPVTEPLPVVKTPVLEEFTAQDFYADAVIVGDVFVEGIGLYVDIDDKKLVFDNTWTTGKAESNAVGKIAATGASKVILEIGINDLNYAGRTTQKIFEDYTSLVNTIRGALPNAQIYVVSVFPITSGRESKASNYIKNSEIAALNGMLSGMDGVKYVDVYGSLIDGTGYLDTNLTTNGLSIKKTYFPFILNLIAELGQTG